MKNQLFKVVNTLSVTINKYFRKYKLRNPSVNNKTDPNQHIKEYLEYYLSFVEAPKYAVLLNGAWGIGKTFFIKNFLESLDVNNEKKFKHVYVSLYGLTSLDEIDTAIFHSMFPILNHKGMRLGGKILKNLSSNALKNLGIDLDLELKKGDFLDKERSEIYIFDDLERCQIPINAVLGYINTFVEHEERKVIIIANENEIVATNKNGDHNSNNYKKIREKLIGKTFDIQSVFEEASRVFINSIKEKSTKKCLKENLSVISEIYHQSELNNLRILQQTIWDFERIFDNLTNEHQNNSDAMTALLKLIFTLSFEIKAGRLSVKDLYNRYYNITRDNISKKHENHPPRPITAAQIRYPDIELSSSSPLLSDQTLEDLLSKGLINKQQIQKELAQSSFFVKVNEEPCWRTVWYYLEREEKQVSNALKEMERKFLNREFTDIGEILHVFGLRLWLNNINAISQMNIVDKGKEYIDDLYEKKLLKLPPSSQNPFRDILDTEFGFHGLGIYEKNNPKFTELRDYLIEKLSEADSDEWPNIAKQLIKDMQKDPKLFHNQICQGHEQNNVYHNKAVLSEADPTEFVKVLLSLHPSKQREVLSSLRIRYKHGSIDSELKLEKDWLIDIRQLLLTASETMSPISKNRLQTLVKRGFDDILGLSVMTQ